MIVTLAEAQRRLPDLIATLLPDEEMIITEGDAAVAHLVSVPKHKPRPQFGSCKGMLTIIADDDDHLEDFAEYMP